MKIFITAFLFFSSYSYSQLSQMRIVGTPQQEPSQIVVKEVRDANGETCAGLIIQSDLKGLTFQSNNGIVKINKESGEDFLFLSADERVVTVYCSGFAPLQIILNEYGIKLRSGQTWSIKVTGDKKLDLIPVNIIVKPEGANISIDGVNKGTITLQQLAEGKHELKIEKEAFKTLIQTITISTTQTLFNFTLQEVELQSVTIASTPEGAKIILDNVDKGETTKGMFLYPNTYSLKLSKSGYFDVQEKISVKENAANKFSFTLNKNAGTLILTVTPNDARVMINKEDYTNKTAIELAPGRYKIEVDKTGYYSATETVDITLGKQKNKTFSLTSKTGGLQVTVTPIDAKVLLKQSGTLIYQWEGLKLLKALQVGEYELEVKANGFITQIKKISVLENNTIRDDITLVLESTPKVNSNGNPSVNAEQNQNPIKLIFDLGFGYDAAWKGIGVNIGLTKKGIFLNGQIDLLANFNMTKSINDGDNIRKYNDFLLGLKYEFTNTNISPFIAGGISYTMKSEDLYKVTTKEKYISTFIMVGIALKIYRDLYIPIMLKASFDQVYMSIGFQYAL